MKSEAFRTDQLFLRNRQFMAGAHQMPFVYAQDVDEAGLTLLGFDHTRRVEWSSSKRQRTVHFFLDDYKFDEVWKQPGNQVKRLSQYAQVLSPDFSVYADMPEALQIYNTFRNRWCASVWQAAKMVVIPTISWAQPKSFGFCFDGVEPGSVVAVSTVGTSKARAQFMSGFEEMLSRIQPRRVIVYGKPHDGMDQLAELTAVPYSLGSAADRA